jgi:hypothetical protein
MELNLGLHYNVSTKYLENVMNIEEAVGYFGNLNRVCIAIEIAPQNMTKWKRQGYIPWKQQFKIATVTDGELLPDDEDPYLLRHPKKPPVKQSRK